MQFDDNNNPTSSTIRKNARIIILIAIISITFILFTIKLFTLQVVEGKNYRVISQRNSSQVKTIPAQRGEIFDRNNNFPMVVNINSFAVDVIPGEIKSDYYDTVIMKLADILGITKNDIDNKINKALYDRKKKTSINKANYFSTIEIKSNVPLEVISNIAENITDLPGVSWRSKPIRNYVETGSISHVLGYVGNITEEEKKVLYNKGYNDNDIVGKTGIELQYEYLLKGTPGKESRKIDARGKILNDDPIIEQPQMGKNLILTIDSRIQTLAEKALGERVGAVVVLKPASGEVLAMVSYPYFDANLFSTDNAATEYTKLANGENKPLLNRAVNAVYPPASTFKTIMSTALLSENSISPDKKIECKGKIVYGDRTFKCHIGYPGHGYLDLKNALAQSCDVYFWIAGRDYLGVDKIASYAKEFGFGQSLQIDLPAQSEGFVPTAQWKERRYHEKWLGGDTMNMSIGQGYTLVTPMHIADMMAMVCNSGTIYTPHLLKEVRDPATDEVIQTIEPEVLQKSTVSPEVWKEVQTDLRYVITNGTAIYPMHNKLVQIAGKTGTAEVNGSHDHWHSWMVAYAPYDAPVEDQVVVAVLVEAVNDWEWWAPYATNIIIQGIFANQTYEESITTLGFKYLMKSRNR